MTVSGLKRAKPTEGHSVTQNLMFDKSKYTLPEAIRWMVDHDYTPFKPVDIAPNFYRFRLTRPYHNVKYRTIELADGILSAIAFAI